MKGKAVSLMVGASIALAATPAAAASGDIAAAIETAFRACHEWVTNPDSWADDIAGFPKTMGLEKVMEHRETVPPFAQPPANLQDGAIYWQIAAGKDELYLSVSVEQPTCRLAGGGPDDWQPGVETVLASRAFRAAWEEGVDHASTGMRLTQYSSKKEEGFTLFVTRADKPGLPPRQAQFLATARLR